MESVNVAIKQCGTGGGVFIRFPYWSASVEKVRVTFMTFVEMIGGWNEPYMKRKLKFFHQSLIGHPGITFEHTLLGIHGVIGILTLR